jgi:polyhydroxybutyrate depolymerase
LATFTNTSWKEFLVEGREVTAFVPDCVQATSPIILSLHAWASNRHQQRDVDHYSKYIGEECAVLVYPQGKIRGPFVFAMGYAWNAGGCCPNADNEGVDDVAFLGQVITETASKFGANGEVAFVSGFSNGGMMANRLACEDQRIKAIVAVSGPLLNGTGSQDPADLTETFACARRVPILHFHGLEDGIVPFTGCNSTTGPTPCRGLLLWLKGRIAPFKGVMAYLKRWRARNGLNESDDGTVTFQNSTCTCTSWGNSIVNNVTLCTLRNEGHAWPGTCSFQSKSKVAPYFNCTLDVDASQQAMAFFKKYLPTPGAPVVFV